MIKVEHGFCGRQFRNSDQPRIVSVFELDLQRPSRRWPDAAVDDTAALEHQIAAGAVMSNCGGALPERIDILSFDD
jgi:hypothetical protein